MNRRELLLGIGTSLVAGPVMGLTELPADMEFNDLLTLAPGGCVTPIDGRIYPFAFDLVKDEWIRLE